MQKKIRIALIFFASLALLSAAQSPATLLLFKNTATSNANAVISFPVDRNDSGITIIKTANLLGEIFALEGPAVELHNTDFAWDFDWSKPWLGAGSLRLAPSTERLRPVFSIMLWGGYIRATGMTLPALEFTICHEFGHFLAGAPHQIFSGEPLHWSSAEGQADWWAASVCLPELYRSRGMTRPESAARTLEAGRDFAHFAHLQYEKGSIEASLEKRAAEIPTKTLTTAYPSTQCRLDTIADAADCALKNHNVGTVSDSVGAAISCTRPRCWFAEEQP
jgi:hypothetical protein